MANRLVSIADLKTALRIPSAETALDTDLGAVIELISGDCQDDTYRNFKKQAYTDETHPGGASQIILKQFPVDTSQTFTLKEYDGNSVSVIATADYSLDDVAGIVTLRFGAKFADQPDAVRVDYTAGYAEAGTGNTLKVGVPEGLSALVLELTKAKWNFDKGVIDATEYHDSRKEVSRSWKRYRRMGAF